ncbi:MAG: ribose-phosphate pyrophosphokinase, partial [Lactococcus plantarum]|nr:ribose-phosphate pyrophosphokinase [Lactococcus plantarum]
SHGLFTPGAAKRLNATCITEVLVTDSVKTETPKPDVVKYLSAAPLLAHAIIRIHENEPVSPLFQYNKSVD